MVAVIPPQPCGGTTGYGCRRPVIPGQGRRSGQTWWHSWPACQSEEARWRGRLALDRKKSAAGLPPVTRGVCRRCGGRRTPRAGSIDIGVCVANRGCRAEARRLRQAAWQSAARAICRRHQAEFQAELRAAAAVIVAALPYPEFAGGPHE